MKVLVISDIHAYVPAEKRGTPSYARVGDGASSSIMELFVKFLENTPEFEPDVIICPGDLCDQAEQAGIVHTWDFLNKLQVKYPKSLLLATAGNHDLDSRYIQSSYDPKGVMNDLKPRFPYVPPQSAGTDYPEVKATSHQFWAENFYIVVHEGIRFVVLNSSAFHGNGKPDGTSPEYAHGRISETTLSHLEEALREDDEKRKKTNRPPIAVNILVCHHHLQKDGNISNTDYSEMVGAHGLLQVMSMSDYGRWMVIHGHKHSARIFNPGGSTGPFILAAASFAAARTDPQNTSPNQVHLVEINLQEMLGSRLLPSGTIKTATYTPNTNAWHFKGAESGGLPPETGFGFRGPIEEIAYQINQAVTKNEPATSKWDDLGNQIPHLKYFTPDQIAELRKILHKEYSIRLELNSDRCPIECGRST
jgi:3',5'-cyclic AMP phosphodiesterase CpdA